MWRRVRVLIGRRYFKPDFKFWGYVRGPGQSWSTAQLVMLNEKQKLAPDRERWWRIRGGATLAVALACWFGERGMAKLHMFA